MEFFRKCKTLIILGIGSIVYTAADNIFIGGFPYSLPLIVGLFCLKRKKLIFTTILWLIVNLCSALNLLCIFKKLACLSCKVNFYFATFFLWFAVVSFVFGLFLLDLLILYFCLWTNKIHILLTEF